jgi:ABC-type transport system substrate-binding protein
VRRLVVETRLRICAEAKPAWFDAHNQIAGAARILAPNIVPGVLRIGDAGEPASSLSTTWAWADSRTLHLEIESGRTFASGRQVDAESVAENIVRAVSVPGSVFNQSEFQAIRECIAVNERELVVRLERPFAPLPGVLANGFGMIDLRRGPPPHNVDGAGDFRVARMSERGYELVSRVEGHTFVEWLFCVSAAARRRRIQSGTVDLLIGEAGAPYAREHGWSTRATAGDGPIHLAFNLRRWPGTSLAFRRRAADAVDRDEIIAKGFSGRGRPGSAPYAPGTAFHLESGGGGIESGGELRNPRQLPELELAVGGDAYLPAARAIARAIQLALRVRVNVVSVSNPEWWPGYYMGGKWDLAVQAWTPMPDPHLVYGRRYASWGIHNAVAYSNRQLDGAVKAAESSIDPRRRLVYYAEAEAIRASDCPTLYLGFPDRLLSARPGVEAPMVRPSWEVEL